MQRLGDRQKMLVAHGVPVSDTRLPLVMFDFRRCTTLEGRILVHGEEEGTGRSYMMMEGTDANVHFIYHTPQIEEMRGRGGLRPNGFVRLRKLFERSRPVLEIAELDRDEELVREREVHQQKAVSRIEGGRLPVEDRWGGGLAHDQKAIREVGIELGEVRKRNRERHRSRDR